MDNKKPSVEVSFTKEGTTFYKHYSKKENKTFNMFDVAHIITPTKKGEGRVFHYIPKTISYWNGEGYSYVKNGTSEWFRCLQALETFFEGSTKVDKN